MNTADETAAAPGTNDPQAKPMHSVTAFFRRYWWLITVVVVGGHLIVWAMNNPETQTVHWIFFTTHSSLGVAIAVAVILGAIFGHLISYQRRSGRQKTQVQQPPTARGRHGHTPP